MTWSKRVRSAVDEHRIVGAMPKFVGVKLPRESMIGTTVGKYRIVALLGHGAAGIVYKAIDVTLDREVAIKVLHPLHAAGDIQKRFRSEATTLAKLSHPEIATIHELLRTDTNLLMVMELVRGETLEVLAERTGPMPPQLAGHILDGILSALEHAHRVGIVHRDLKPANVMVTELGGVKIMDFGVARVRGAEHMTMDGCAVGTPSYMAPEQVLGEDVDGCADLYAVGLIFYRLVAGRLPFDADTPMVMLQKQVSETPAPLQTYRRDLPDWCEILVQRALAKAPADRFQSADEFRAAVGRAIGLSPTLDLAKVLGVSSMSVSSEAPQRQPVETIAISRSEAGLPAVTRAGVAAWIDDTAFARLEVVKHHLAAVLLRTRGLVAKRKRAAIVAGVCVAGALVYLSGVTSATSAGTARRENRRADRPTETDARASKPASTRTEPSATRSESTGSERRVTPSATAPVVFRAKLVRREGRERREEDARLSFAREWLSVTKNRAPDAPVFSVPYGAITAIEHSREPGWKPPQKWSRVITIGDDVLATFGVRDRHEISLQAESDVVVLRIDDQIVNRVLRMLEERTGVRRDLASPR